MSAIHIYKDEKKQTATFKMDIGELETEIELPNVFIKEIEEKALNELRKKIFKNDELITT